MRVKENKAHREAKEKRREISEVKPYDGYQFSVSIDGLPAAGFNRISGLRADRVLVDDLDDPGRLLPEDRLALEQAAEGLTARMPNAVAPITFERSDLDCSDFADWFKERLR